MQILKYIKFIIALLFAEFVFGKICFEYGQYSTPVGIGWWYGYLVFAIILAVVMFCDAKENYSFKLNIGSAIYIFIPILMIIIAACTGGTVSELGVTITFCVLVGISLILEVITLVLKVRKYNK